MPFGPVYLTAYPQEIFNSASHSPVSAAHFEEFKALRSFVNNLSDLNHNWDGYGASSIEPEARANALRLIGVIEPGSPGLPLPEISPKPTGTISFEWETPHAEVYIEVGNTRYSGFVQVKQQQPIYIQNDAASLDQNILALIQSAILSPTSATAVTEIRSKAPWHDRLAA